MTLAKSTLIIGIGLSKTRLYVYALKAVSMLIADLRGGERRQCRQFEICVHFSPPRPADRIESSERRASFRFVALYPCR